MPKPVLTPAALRSLLERRIGAMDRFRPLAEGLDSRAFAFRRDGEEYVVRIREAIEGFHKERFVRDNFHSPRLPIPAVREVGRLDDGHAYCVSVQASGVRVHEAGAGRIAGLLGALVELMEAIADAGSRSGAAAGFGPFDGSGGGAYGSWCDYLASFVEGERLDWGSLAGSIDMAMVDEMRALVGLYSACCPEEHSLIHGDFGSFNLITDGGRITAVIDWDRAAFGDPLYDVANLIFWGEELLAPLIERLAEQGGAIPRWAERTYCYQLCIGLQELYDSATGRTPVDLAWLTDRATALLEAGPTGG